MSDEQNPEPTQTSLIIAAAIEIWRVKLCEQATQRLLPLIQLACDKEFEKAINGDMDAEVLDMVNKIKKEIQCAPKIYEEQLSN